MTLANNKGIIPDIRIFFSIFFVQITGEKVSGSQKRCLLLAKSQIFPLATTYKQSHAI